MKTLLAWSSGKDSAWTLHVLRQQGLAPSALLTTINEAADRVAMHGVRRALLEAQSEAAGVPLWQIPTAQLAEEMIGAGVRARLSCIDSKVLAPEFAGREFNRTLLDDLPEGIDPCGENGEFDTFVYEGPMFRTRIDIEASEIRDVGGFVYADLLLCSHASSH